MFKGFSEQKWDIFLKSLCAVNDQNSDKIFQEIEELRKFASFHGRNLLDVSKKRFKKSADFQLEKLLQLFLFKKELLLKYTEINPSIKIDQANLNAALYCYDALKKLKSKNLKFYNKQILSSQNDLKLQIDALNRKLDSNISKKKYKMLFKELLEISDNKRFNEPIVIFCPNPFSLYTLCTAALCLKLNISISAIVVKKFSFKRFKSEFRRDGFRLFKKFYRKVILRKDENREKIMLSYKDLKNILIPNFASIFRFSKINNIPIYRVNELDESIKYLKNKNPVIGLFTGGGLVSQDLIDLFKIGIINVHMGILPFYKGMDVVKASILEGRNDLVGITAHLMSKKIDAGPILNILNCNSIIEYDSLGKLRNEIGLLMPFLLVSSAIKLLINRNDFIMQDLRGRQYYIVHRKLEHLVDYCLKNSFSYSDYKNTNINSIIKFLLKELDFI